MDAKAQIEAALRRALASVAPEQAGTPIHLERPRQPEHGDFSSNLAMQLGRALKKNPRELAQALAGMISDSEIAAECP